MYKHPHFDLWLHDNGELEPFINGLVYARVTLKEWPLSCVQRIVHYDARRYIYKAQRYPSVEADFYEKARSPLLLGARTIYRQDPYTCLLLEHVEAPSLEARALSEKDALRIGRELLDQIAEIRGDPPCYLDVSNPDKWRVLVEETLGLLQTLVDKGVFRRVTGSMLKDVSRWALGKSVLDLFAGRTGLVHGDLTGENIFCLPDGYRVIDWQRPIFGPIELDLATFLASSGVDPARYVNKAVLYAHCFLQIRWWVECASFWFPPGADGYERLIADTLVQML